MVKHPVRPRYHCGHLHGRAGDRLCPLSVRQQRESRRAGLPAGVPGGCALHEGAVQRCCLSVAQRRLRLVPGPRQRLQFHQLVPAGALDQGRPHVRDQRLGGEMQREEFRALPARGGATRLQVRHAGPHVDPAGGGDRGGDPGPGVPADRYRGAG